MIERTQAKCTWGWEIEVEDLVRWAHETLEAEGIHEFTFTFLKGIDDNFKDEDTAEENRFSCQDLVEEVVNRAIDGGESGDASDGEQRDQTVQVTDASPIEAHLLAHDANSSIVHGPFVRDYGELLDRAAAKCPEGRETVGKLAIAGHEDGDVRMLTREILQEIDENFGAGELRERGLTPHPTRKRGKFLKWPADVHRRSPRHQRVRRDRGRFRIFSACSRTAVCSRS